MARRTSSSASAAGLAALPVTARSPPLRAAAPGPSPRPASFCPPWRTSRRRRRAPRRRPRSPGRAGPPPGRAACTGPTGSTSAPRRMRRAYGHVQGELAGERIERAAARLGEVEPGIGLGQQVVGRAVAGEELEMASSAARAAGGGCRAGPRRAAGRARCGPRGRRRAAARRRRRAAASGGRRPSPRRRSARRTSGGAAPGSSSTSRQAAAMSATPTAASGLPPLGQRVGLQGVGHRLVEEDGDRRRRRAPRCRGTASGGGAWRGAEERHHRRRHRLGGRRRRAAAAGRRSAPRRTRPVTL